MKIRSVTHNNRRKAFQVKTRTKTFWFPYAKLDVPPKPDDKIVKLYVDKDIGGEGFTYVLDSGKGDTVHIDQVLMYNEDPRYLSDILLYKLTIEAQKRIDTCPLSKREIIRRLGTSATQFYRLLDQTNYTKSLGQLLALLHILDCDVDFIVRKKSA